MFSFTINSKHTTLSLLQETVIYKKKLTILFSQILQKYATEWIVQIEDITTFVREQHQLYLQVGEDCLLTPSERVYPIMDQGVANRIQLDSYEDPHNHPALGET